MDMLRTWLRIVRGDSRCLKAAWRFTLPESWLRIVRGELKTESCVPRIRLLKTYWRLTDRLKNLLYCLVKVHKPYFWPNSLHGVTETSGAECLKKHDLLLKCICCSFPSLTAWRISYEFEGSNCCKNAGVFVIIMPFLQYCCKHPLEDWSCDHILRETRLLRLPIMLTA